MRVHVLARRRHPSRATTIIVVPGTGDPDGMLPDRVFTHGQKTEFLRGLDFLVLAMPLTPATEGHRRRSELQAAAAARVPAQSRARAAGPGGSAAAGPARRLDRRRGARHALPLPDAAGPPAVAHAQRHHDPAHLRLRRKHAVPPAGVGDLQRELETVSDGTTADERIVCECIRGE